MTSLKSTQQTQANNVDIVTPNIIKSSISSANFMKELTVVAISTLTLLKYVCPKYNNFIEQNFGGTSVWVLKEKCKDGIAQFVSDSIRKSFEAIDKKYLAQIALCFYQNGTSLDDLLEYYLIEIDYKNNSISMCSNTNDKNSSTTNIGFEGIKQATINLINTCKMMTHCNPLLPEEYDVMIRFYYNNDAPKGYQPQGFTVGNKRDENIFSLIDDQWDSQMIGCVATPFHELNIHTYFRQDLPASNKANLLSATPRLEDEDLIETAPSIRDNPPPMTCPCLKSKKYSIEKLNLKKPRLLVKCANCRTIQHAACFGILAEDKERREKHYCDKCFKNNNKYEFADHKTYYFDNNRLMATYALRHILQLFMEVNTFSPKELMDIFNMTKSFVKKVLWVLSDNKVIQFQSKFELTKPVKISAKDVDESMKLYFYNYKSNEKEVSKEPVPQNAETGSRKPETDETIEQFRNAIRKDNEPVSDELPLSGSHNPVNLNESTHFKRKVTAANSENKNAKKARKVTFDK